MTEISELESRITGALDRIGQVVEQLGGGGADLSAELEAERSANAQLEERVHAIKERQETVVASLEGEVARLKEALAVRDVEYQRIRKVNGELRRTNQSLREANATGLGDAHLVNKSMMAELEALRASRASDRAEIDDLIATLEPIVREAESA